MWRLWGGDEPIEPWLKWTFAAAAATSAIILLALGAFVLPIVSEMLTVLATSD
ncbi:hypothetical protein ABT369_47135 [Dactylosporangium sp. NPDC000244]|uniref:hypothetical protein n=1 Tax=Dactylosporangium sp. NPDC000244 TaxID=3154365 RepID=UPI00331A31AC